MYFAIIVFPGSNCDYDAYYLLKNILHCKVDFIWHRDTDLKKYDVIIIPGGFSYGDYLRTGSIARFSPVMESVIKESKSGKLIMGICNGFQILIESGLLPGALIINQNIKFLSQNVMLNVETTDCNYTSLLNHGDKLIMPIAHKQGNYIADNNTLEKLNNEDRVVFRYQGQDQENPNGSIDSIAGILNSKRNVLGMMPHPERAAENVLGSEDGLQIFKSVLKGI